MLGAASNALIVVLAANNAANETGVGVAAVAAGAVAVVATTANYSLSNVKFTIVRYDLPSEFYMTEQARLGSGAT